MPISEFAATDSERDQLAEIGFFTRERVFPESDLVGLRGAIEDIHTKVLQELADGAPPPMQYVDDKRYQDLLGSTVKWEWSEGATDIRSMEPFIYLHPKLNALVDDPRIADPAQSIIGTDEISLFTDKLNYKRPMGSPFPWHQDSPYFAFGCDHVDQLLSMQIYLDDATTENGCLWMIPRSHKHGILPGVQGKGVLDRLYTDMEAFKGEEPIPMAVPAGSVLFFHAHVIHGSRTNNTDMSRRAMVFTYQPGVQAKWRSDTARPITAH